MSKRVSLPYSTQDLFPSAPGPGLVSVGVSPKPTTKSSPVAPIKRMIKRLFKPTTLDFETAVWEMVNLIINPKKMYRSHYYYKQTSAGRTSYTREDPSFLILLTSFLSISAVAWGIAYSPHIWDIFKLIIYMVMVDFYLTGAVIASVSWLATNRLFNGNFTRYNANYIEWGFCFEIHCNSFLIIWCLLYIVQFLLLPFLRSKNSFLSLLLGNSLYFGAMGYYFVITFYGFNSLPFVNNSAANSGKGWAGNPAKLFQMIIVAIILPLLALGWLLTLCFRFNVAYSMVDTYFN